MTGADRSESRKVGKKRGGTSTMGGGKSHCSLETRVSLRSTGWNQTYSLSLERKGEREEDINLAFT